ncbi:hypothetical protein KJ765_01545 [Candidatus Micrarchaeota archaeon]|nr:hypothetical protein [Candidatus Micrarchaeota archaeon]
MSLSLRLNGKRAQTAMEYTFLIAGALLFVLLVFIMLRSGVFTASEHNIGHQTGTFLDEYGKSYLCYDNFEKTQARNWEPVSGSWSVQNREYAQLDNGGSGFVSFVQCAPSDFSYQGLIRTMGGLEGAGLIFRAQNTSNYYQVVLLAASETINLQLVQDSGVTMLDTCSTCFDGALLGTGLTVRVDVFGNQLTVYVNDVQKLTATDNTFSEGLLGVYSVKEGFFDSIRACSTPC